MFDKFLKKYQWYRPELEKKAKNYNYLTLIIGVIALICLYTLPENLKIIITLIVAIGIIMVFLSWRTQEMDKKLKKIAQTKK